VHRITWALAALFVPLAGCGDDSHALSSTEFQKQANAICKQGDAELVEKGRTLFGPDGKATPSAEALAAYFRNDALPVARTKLDGIDKLDPPRDDRKKVDRMLTAGRRAIQQVDEELKKDPVAYLSAKGPDPFAEFNRLGGELSLDDCTAGEQDHQEGQQ
jgi:hypothetical protein